MEQIALELRVTRLIINGHIPLPSTLTAAAKFLGEYNTTSLLLAVLKSPAMGETRGDGRGKSVVKLKPGNKGWGHEAAPVVRRQPPSGPAQRLAATRVPWATRSLHHQPVPVITVGFKAISGCQQIFAEFHLHDGQWRSGVSPQQDESVDVFYPRIFPFHPQDGWSHGIQSCCVGNIESGKTCDALLRIHVG